MSWNVSVNSGVLRWMVILFVRMWVEMPFAFSSFSKAMSSSSSWGCELKYARKPRDPKLIARHPLREDVSWNIGMAVKQSETIASSSSWGCELKYLRKSRKDLEAESSSSWGCELKYCNDCAKAIKSNGHPLREDVSWNDLNGFKYMVGASHPLREDVSWNASSCSVIRTR